MKPTDLTDDQRDRLPVYAREYIARLEQEIRDLTDERDAVLKESPLVEGNE